MIDVEIPIPEDRFNGAYYIKGFKAGRDQFIELATPTQSRPRVARDRAEILQEIKQLKVQTQGVVAEDESEWKSGFIHALASLVQLNYPVKTDERLVLDLLLSRVVNRWDAATGKPDYALIEFKVMQSHEVEEKLLQTAKENEKRILVWSLHDYLGFR